MAPHKSNIRIVKKFKEIYTAEIYTLFLNLEFSYGSFLTQATALQHYSFSNALCYAFVHIFKQGNLKYTIQNCHMLVFYLCTVLIQVQRSYYLVHNMGKESSIYSQRDTVVTKMLTCHFWQ